MIGYISKSLVNIFEFIVRRKSLAWLLNLSVRCYSTPGSLSQLRACVSCVDMFPHLHSQLCLPDAPSWLSSSVGLDRSRGAASAGPAVHTFRPHEARAVYHPNHTPSILYPFIQVVSCPTFKQRHLFSRVSQLFNPSHPCTGLLFDTLNECVCSHSFLPHTLFSFYIPRWLTFTSISHSGFDSHNFFLCRHSPQTQDWLFLAARIPALSSPPLPDAFWRSGSKRCLVSWQQKGGCAPNPQSEKSQCGRAETWRDTERCTGECGCHGGEAAGIL